MPRAIVPSVGHHQLFLLANIQHIYHKNTRNTIIMYKHIHQKYNKHIPNIYLNISKYVEVLRIYTKVYKIPSGGGAAPAGPLPAPIVYILV